MDRGVEIEVECNGGDEDATPLIRFTIRSGLITLTFEADSDQPWSNLISACLVGRACTLTLSDDMDINICGDIATFAKCNAHGSMVISMPAAVCQSAFCKAAALVISWHHR